MQIILDLTQRQADYLVAAACDFYHKMTTAHQDEIFGAYVASSEVRDARATWEALEAKIGTAKWDTPELPERKKKLLEQ